jgi:hypothetical protein
MKKQIWLALAALLAAALACTSSSGSAVGSGESCDRNGNAGTCKGSYSKLSGAYSKTVKADPVHANDAVPVDITVSVESGTVRVSAKAPDGTVASAEANPGTPATLSGNATGALGQFTVTFEAVGGDATGVTYTIAYQIP